MNLRDLRYLLALSEHRHFGRAAEACFVSQPTLSTQIKKLEEELGVELIERNPRNAMLTAAGQEIIGHARRILADVDEMKQVALRCQDPDAGTLRLGVFPTLGPYLLPHIVPLIRAQFPRLELLLTEDKTEILLQSLKIGKLDAACLALPINDEQLNQEFLFEEPFYLAVPDNHPFKNHRSLRLDELQNQNLLLLEDGHCLRDQALEVCSLSGAKERDGFRATSLETLRQMVAAGVGMTLLPALAVQPPIAATANIRLLPFRAPAPSRKIALVWRKSSGLNSFMRDLSKVIQSLPSDLLSQTPPITSSQAR